MKNINIALLEFYGPKEKLLFEHEIGLHEEPIEFEQSVSINGTVLVVLLTFMPLSGGICCMIGEGGVVHRMVSEPQRPIMTITSLVNQDSPLSVLFWKNDKKHHLFVSVS
jgi:hypothetical protein